MKLGRRKFFGLAGAAAIGGKKVATDVLADMAQNPSIGGYIGGGLQAATSTFPPEPGDYLAHLRGQAAKMAALKAIGVPPIIRDFFRDWNGHPECNVDDINSFVSVSDTAKKRMIRERFADAAFDNWLNGAGRQLKRETLRREIGTNFGVVF